MTARRGARVGVYAPVVRHTRDSHRAQAARVEFDASQGACAGLAPEVADRYFGANFYTHPFEYATARMICTGCPVQVECLADAITQEVPRGTRGMRGGESAHAQVALKAEHNRSRENARRLAEREVSRQLPPLRGAYGSPGLRAGEFTSPRPLR
jgi:hypothetical protein